MKNCCLVLVGAYNHTSRPAQCLLSRLCRCRRGSRCKQRVTLLHKVGQPVHRQPVQTKQGSGQRLGEVDFSWLDGRSPPELEYLAENVPIAHHITAFWHWNVSENNKQKLSCCWIQIQISLEVKIQMSVKTRMNCASIQRFQTRRLF